MATRTRCIHHWLIEYPTGEKSRGVCKRCGLHRRFQNYDRNRQPLATRNAKQAEAKRKAPRRP